VAGAAVVGQLDAVAQGSIQQQLAAGRQKAFAIDGYLVMSCHCLSLILQGFFEYRPQTWSVLRRQSGEKSEIIWRQIGPIAPQMTMREKSEEFILSAKSLGGRKFASVIVLLGRGHRMALFRINNPSSLLKSAQAPFSRTMQIGAAHTEGY
jgi:hypothetical protein